MTRISAPDDQRVIPAHPGPVAANRRRQLELAAIALAVIVLFVATVPHLGHSLDDAFITYRYARNLAEGHGLAFNPGEQHLGTTSPGWAMVLAAGGFLTATDAIPNISGALSVLALIAALAVLAGSLAPGRAIAVFSVSLVLAASCRWLIEVLGFEGFALSAAVLIALRAAFAGHHFAAGVIWAAATLLRPDAGALGAVAGLVEWRRMSRIPWRMAIGFTLAITFGAFLVWWFAGTVVPSSWAVKAAEGREPVFARSAGYWEALGQYCWYHWGWTGPAFGVLACFGWWSAVRARRAVAGPILVVAFASLTVYPLLGVPFAPWYVIFPLVALLMGSAYMLVESWALCRVWRATAATAVVLAWVLPQVLSTWRLGSVPPDGRMTHLMTASAVVAAAAAPDDTVAAVEVGFLGFALRQPMLDLVGLGSPGALKAMTSGRIAEFFVAHEPAFLIYNTNFHYLLGPLVDAPSFAARWQVIKTVPPDQRHRTSLVIYQRRAESAMQ